MTRELPPYCQLYAQDENGCFSNLVVHGGRAIGPDHVTRGNPLLIDPIDGESARVSFKKFPTRIDLSRSVDNLQKTGFEAAAEAKVGETLIILGFRGALHTPFEIIVTVLEVFSNGRIKVQRVSGEKAAVGMSGSAAINTKNELVGVLSGGVENSPDNEQLYLEAVLDLE